MARRRFRSAGWPLHASDLQSGGHRRHCARHRRLDSLSLWQGRLDPITIADPLASEFAAIAAKHSYDAVSFADALLRVEAVFGDLGRNPAFAAPVKRLVSQLFSGWGAGDDFCGELTVCAQTYRKP